ncbi:uncharacterized protein LOC123263846 isoform X2 [Cotesia glomerata]|uniref:uncharacterized protein LOC123263846 isoform X2 n=1 Tax=Cotesia glomerata TaxID=32391 RepID=UPI001D01086D|nr:uncharacterized protein LOC123263846 isoform X2 [Cotesia glomerata]
MSEYQYLTSEIQVPKEWPVNIARQLFEHLVKNATIRHRKGQQVVVTIENVSAVVTKFKNKPGYILEKIEEIKDESTYKIDLIFPAKVVILPLKPGGIHRREEESIQCLPIILKSDHFISSMLVLNPKLHQVITVEPNMEKILKLKGITGPEKYNYGFQTTYTIRKIKCLDDNVRDIEPTPSTSAEPSTSAGSSTSAGPSTSQEQITDDEWNIMTYDKLSPHKQFRCSWKAASPWICYLVNIVFIILLIYLCVILTINYERF